MHINWLKNQICVLWCILRTHARNGNEFQTPGHRWLPAKHWDAWFFNLVNPKLVWNSWNLACYHGVASTCRGTNFVPFGAGLGICFSQTGASHNKHDGFRWGTSHLWGRNDIHCLLLLSKNFSCQQRTSGVLCDFSGFVWTFYALTDFSMHFMCIIQIWTTCTCSSAYKLAEKSNLCPWVHA